MRTPDSPRSSTDAIFEVLRERICLLDYPPGSQLSEARLAEEFGVSRTPVRSALQRLAQAGLIESKDGVGTLVTDPATEEIRDVYQMRIKIAEWIGHMNPQPLTADHLRQALDLHERATRLCRRFRIGEYWRINHDMHFLVSGVIGNRALRQMWDQCYFRAARYWYRYAKANPLGVAESLVAQLAEVIRALEERDPVALGYIQRNYIAYGLARLDGADAAVDESVPHEGVGIGD